MANKDNFNNNDKQLFYGVSLPSDAIKEEEAKLVFDNMKELSEVLKKFKGSRFKVFSDINEAILFSNSVVISKDVDSSDQNQSNANIEKLLCPFSGLHPRELSKLRKAIESGNIDTVEQLIECNPRYLVTSGDTPSILMEGPRYNACHIAAKANKYDIIRLILNRVSKKQFWKQLFPFDANEVTDSRINFSLDLYLNTPCSERALCDTPLHLGCKWGSLETVSVLLSYPNCDLEKTNKLGKKPLEVVCERKGDNKTKSEIIKLFESQLYIPLIRADFKAQIGKPIKGMIKMSDMNREVAAVAGPMSPNQAEELYKTLKSPHRCTPNHRRIRLTDERKGLERVCRNLCKEMDINFNEFWPFLNTRIDLTSEEGLNRLEEHLQHIYYDLDKNSSKSHSLASEASKDQTIDTSELISQMSNLSLNLNDVSITEDRQSDSSQEYSNCQQNFNIMRELSFDESSNDSFTSASSEPIFLYAFYVNGENITREDIDAALALQHIIDSDLCLKYYFIQDWFKRLIDERPQDFDIFSTFNSSLTSTPIKSKYF